MSNLSVGELGAAFEAYKKYGGAALFAVNPILDTTSFLEDLFLRNGYVVEKGFTFGFGLDANIGNLLGASGGVSSDGSSIEIGGSLQFPFGIDFAAGISITDKGPPEWKPSSTSTLYEINVGSVSASILKQLFGEAKYAAIADGLKDFGAAVPLTLALTIKTEKTRQGPNGRLIMEEGEIALALIPGWTVKDVIDMHGGAMWQMTGHFKDKATTIHADLIPALSAYIDSPEGSKLNVGIMTNSASRAAALLEIENKLKVSVTPDLSGYAAQLLYEAVGLTGLVEFQRFPSPFLQNTLEWPAGGNTVTVSKFTESGASRHVVTHEVSRIEQDTLRVLNSRNLAEDPIIAYNTGDARSTYNAYVFDESGIVVKDSSGRARASSMTRWFDNDQIAAGVPRRYYMFDGETGLSGTKSLDGTALLNLDNEWKAAIESQLKGGTTRVVVIIDGDSNSGSFVVQGVSSDPSDAGAISITQFNGEKEIVVTASRKSSNNTGLGDEVEVRTSTGNVRILDKELAEIIRSTERTAAGAANGITEFLQATSVSSSRIVFENTSGGVSVHIDGSDGDSIQDLRQTRKYNSLGSLEYLETFYADDRKILDVDSGIVRPGTDQDIYLRDSAGQLALRNGKYRQSVGLRDTQGISKVSTYTAGPLKGITRIDLKGAPLGIDFREAGAILGNVLGKSLAGDNRIAQVATSAVLKTIGGTLGSALNGAIGGADAESMKKVFQSFDDELLRNLGLKAVGALSSFIASELVDAIGLDGLAGDVADTALSELFRSELSNLLGLQSNAVSVNVLTAVGGLLGTKLAAEIVQFDTVGGQIGSSLGASLGTLAAGEFLKIGGLLGGPLGAAIGAFAGFILGGLIGSLFGGIPRSGADVQWDGSKQEFIVANVYSKKGGSKDAARSMASAAAQTFNGILAATGGILLDPGAVLAGNYGMRKEDLVYRTYSTRDKDAITFRVSSDEEGAMSRIIGYGVYEGLSSSGFKIVGGDVYVKRALYNTIDYGGMNASDFGTTVLAANLETARRYEAYLSNQNVVNSLVSAEPDSLFAVETALLLSRASDLGLARRARSDWFGGYGALMDEANTTASMVSFGFEYDSRIDRFSRKIAVGIYALSDPIAKAGQTVIVADGNPNIIDLRGNVLVDQRGYTVNGHLNNDIAISTEDYTAKVGVSLSFAANTLRASSGITIKANISTPSENAEYFDVALDSAPDMVIVGPPAQVTIAKEGDKTYLMVGRSYAAEGEGYAIFRVSLSRALGTGESVALSLALGELTAQAGVDYDAMLQYATSPTATSWTTGSALTFSGTTIQYYVRVPIRADNGGTAAAPTGIEGNETFKLTATVTAGAANLTNGATPVSGIGTILDASLRQDAAGTATAGDYKPFVWADDLIVHASNTAAVTGYVSIGRSGVLASAASLVHSTVDRRRVDIDVAATVDAGGGNDTVHASDRGDNVFGGAGDDTLFGGRLDDWLIGGDGHDTLDAGAQDQTKLGGDGNYLNGGAGNDTLKGREGSDWLEGGDGTDKLYGNDGDDILAGGAGADELYGGKGADHYLFRRGDGVDIAEDAGGSVGDRDSIAALVAARNARTAARDWTGEGIYSENGAPYNGEDRVTFGEGIGLGDLELARSASSQNQGMDLIIRVSGPNGVDQLTIKGWFDSMKRVEWLEFADGQAIRIGDFVSYTVGTGGNDVIIGTDGSDFVVGLDGNDILQLLGGDDVGLGGAGDDMIGGDGGRDVLVGGSDDDTMFGGADADVMSGDGGNDDMNGGAGNDIISGGRGTDFMAGSTGSDVFRINRGDGRDTVIDEYAGTWETVWTTAGSWNAAQGYVYSSATNKLTRNGSEVVFDGSEWHGKFNYDFVTGNGSAGTGTLYRLIPDVGGRVAKDAETGDSDVLEFGLGINIQDLTLFKSGNDLIVGIGTENGADLVFANIADQVLLKDWFTDGSQATVPIEGFAFAAVGTIDMTATYVGSQGTDADNTLNGRSGADWITGGAGDDVISGNAGQDILNGNSGNDTLKGGADDDVLYGGAGDDTLDGGAGKDVIVGGAGADVVSFDSTVVDPNKLFQAVAFLKDATIRLGDARGDSYTAIEGFGGSGGTDLLGGDDGQNILWGGADAAADFLHGGMGDDIYVYERGNGVDTIVDSSFTVEEIVSLGVGSAPATLNAAYTTVWTYLGTDIQAGVTYYRYRLQVKRGTELVYDSSSYRYPALQGTAPAPAGWDPAGWTADITRTAADQVIRIKQDASVNAGDDTLEMGAGISLSDLSFAWVGNDLEISVGGSKAVVLKNQAVANQRIETLQLQDGMAIDLTKLLLAANGTNGVDDVIAGTVGNNTLSGNSGADILSGGAGNDILYGGDGDDILEGGTGADTLNGGAGGDTVRYVTSSAAVTVDLGLATAQAGGDAEGDILAGIENIVGSVAGADMLTGDAADNQLFGLDGNDTLTGNAGDDVLVGDAGNDTLYGGDGEDNIAGGEGDDTISGGNGNDLIDAGGGVNTVHGDAGDDQIIGGISRDYLYGDAGKDTLVGGDGNDSLYGGTEDDLLKGGSGNDSLVGGAGDDTYLFSATDGNDTITETSGVNTILFDSSVDYRKIWLSHAEGSNDLVIGIVGSSATVTIKSYYPGKSAIRSIATPTHAIYLASADALIAMMSEAALGAPSSVPGAVATSLENYWWEGGNARPTVENLEISTNEDMATPLLDFGAVDHDNNITGYSVRTAPQIGAVTLDPVTGKFSYLPNANKFGVDSFVLTVTDANGNQVDKTVKVTVVPVNDAPTDIALALDPAVQSGIPENSPDAGGIIIGTLSVADVDRPEDSDFGQSKLMIVSDSRFQIVGNLLKLKPNVTLDYEREPVINLAIRATDRNGAGLSIEKTLQIAVKDLVDVKLGTSEPNSIVGAQGIDDIKGFDGNDLLKGMAGNDLLDGGNGDDTLWGGDGDDTILGGAGVDTIYGEAGNDTIAAGSENDLVYGGDGNDIISGEAGNDTLYGEADNDVLNGGDGDDTLFGGTGADQLNGGAGTDIADYSKSARTANPTVGVTVDMTNMAANAGDAAGDSFSSIEGVRGTNLADILKGDAANNQFFGLGGNDDIDGGGGDDTIDGGAGNDTIDGGAGNDVLIGGAGNDILMGGAGNDTYIVTRTSGADTINNYHTNAADNDTLGFQDTIEDMELWFQRSGNDLLISVIGTSTSTRIKDWYLISTASEQTNYKIKFIEAGVSRVINVEGLVDLMRDEVKPVDKAAHELLMAEPEYKAAWDSFWGDNPAPIVSTIANQTLSEDIPLAVSITVTDTHDGTVPSDPSSLKIFAKVYDLVTGDDIIDSGNVLVSFGTPDAQGQRTMTLASASNFAGTARVKVWASDAGGRYSEERSFDVTIDAKADMPTIQVATAGNGDNKGSFFGGTTIPLNLTVDFPDRDGSETHAIMITGVPSGITLNKGIYDAATQTWTLTEADLAGLALVGPASWSTNISLGVTARAVETSGGDSKTTLVKTILVDVNAAPTDITVTGSIMENSAFETGGITLAAVDPDGGAFTYEWVDNPNNRFAINSVTGAITVATNDPSQINFETSTLAANAVKVRVTDNGGLSFVKTINLPIGDMNERPGFAKGAYSFAAIAENVVVGTVIGTVTATDPDTAANFAQKKYYFQNDGGTLLSSQDGNVRYSNVSSDGKFRIDETTGQITLASGVSFEDAGSYTHTVYVTDGLSGGGARVNSATVTIPITDVNEAPTLVMPNVTINEQPANPTLWQWGPSGFSDPDTKASYRDFFFSLSGANSDYFLINNKTGQIALQKSLNFEDPNDPKTFNLTMNLWDGGAEGAGNLTQKNFTINVADANEAPIVSTNMVLLPSSAIDGIYTSHLNGWISVYDEDAVDKALGPEIIEIRNAYQKGGSGWESVTPYVRYTPGSTSGKVILPPYTEFKYEAWAKDRTGIWSYVSNYVKNGVSNLSPLVLDLNGDGINLKSVTGSNVRFDMNGDGQADVTGWVGAEDGLLAIDLNGDGMIDRGSEISFQSALPGSVSDLEGLRAYDSNGDGFLNKDDARFGEFRIWQDLNQDGISQAGELKDLTQVGISAINLTLQTTGATSDNYGFENTIYGYSEFIRSDGTLGRVGDVFLRYLTGETTSIMGDHGVVVGIDIDGGGVALTQLYDSAVAFDMHLTGGLQNTAWIASGDAILAIDLDGDGLITSSRELSLGEVDNALSPLNSYDSNGDGIVDSSDAHYADFRIWQDANQDGISQSSELRTLIEAGIARISVPGQPGSFTAAAGESLSYGAISLGMADGSTGAASSLLLAYGRNDVGAIAPPIIVNWDGDDKQFVSLGASSTRFDMNGDGIADRTSWLDQGDAFLALDRNNNGIIDGIGEISFVGDKAGAKTDLEGLRGFDSNGDGMLTAADERFSSFKLWFDNNGNGTTQAGELLSLTDLGVTAIDLVGTPAATPEVSGGNRIYNHTRLLKADGTAIATIDVGLSYLPGAAAGGSAGGIANTDGAPPPAGASEGLVPTIDPAARSYDRKAKKYMLVARNGGLFVSLRKAEGALDPEAGRTRLTAMLSFKNWDVGIFSPVVLDLDGDGIELRSLKKTHASFDLNGDGKADRAGWVDKDDGFLVIDRDRDGKISATSELTFASEKSDARSGLDALAVLDANRDGKLSSADARFGELKVWRDGNGNGVTDAGELKSLSELGITEIGLGATATTERVKVGQNLTVATASFKRSDGSTATVGDVALSFEPGTGRPSMGTIIRDMLRGDLSRDDVRLAQLREQLRPGGVDAGPSSAEALAAIGAGEGLADQRIAQMIQAMGGFGATAGETMLNQREQGYASPLAYLAASAA